MESLLMGQKIDAGVNAENIPMSLSGASLRKDACGFSESRSSSAVLKEIRAFQKQLSEQISRHLRNESTVPMAELAIKIKKLL